jgi:aminopeptidase
MNAGLSLEDYTDFAFKACMPDYNDPVSYWKRFSANQQRVVDWLTGKKKVRVKSNETDVTLSVEGRKFINCDGKENMPDGEIYTSPVEDSAEGSVYFSYPAIFNGNEVNGIRLTFARGKVVSATAEKNEKFLNDMLDTDEGSRHLGEFAIGTNEGIDHFTGEILFDEKINGSFHLALGAGFPECDGKNESGLHWDMVCDLRNGGEIWVDDVLFYKSGKFLI